MSHYQDKAQLSFIEPGHTFYEVGAFSDQPNPATAVAPEKTHDIYHPQNLSIGTGKRPLNRIHYKTYNHILTNAISEERLFSKEGKSVKFIDRPIPY